MGLRGSAYIDAPEPSLATAWYVRLVFEVGHRPGHNFVTAQSAMSCAH